RPCPTPLSGLLTEKVPRRSRKPAARRAVRPRGGPAGYLGSRAARRQAPPLLGRGHYVLFNDVPHVGQGVEQVARGPPGAGREFVLPRLPHGRLHVPQALAEAFDDRPRRLRRDGRQRLLVAQQIHPRGAPVLPLPGHGPGVSMDNGIAQPAHGFSSHSCTTSPPAAKRRGEFSFRHRWTAPGRQATNAVLILSGVTTTMAPLAQTPSRSEERRVGKECRSRWRPYA